MLVLVTTVISFSDKYQCIHSKHTIYKHKISWNGKSNTEESPYLGVNLAAWCQVNNLNIKKTKELIVDFSRTQRGKCSPLTISKSPVMRVKSLQIPWSSAYRGPLMDTTIASQ